MDESVGVWDLETGSQLKSFHLNSPVSDIQVSLDGRFALAACWDGTVRYLDLSSETITMLSGHTDRVLACALAPDGLRKVSASADHTLRYWDLESASTFALLAGHTAEVTGCAFTRLGRYIISRSKDKRLGIWDARSGALIAFTEGHTDQVTAFASDEDEGIVYSCSEDQTVRVWDLETGEPRGVVYGVSPFRSLAAVAGGVYAGDEAGNLWVLELSVGEAEGRTLRRGRPDFADPNDAGLDQLSQGWVYISSAQEDKKIAQELRRLLEQQGIKAWLDEPRLQAGDDFEELCRRRIDGSILFLPLISRSTLTPELRFFRMEWRYAFSRSRMFPPDRRFIMPVLIDDTNLDAPALPEEIRKLHVHSWQGESSRQDLLREILDVYRKNGPRSLSS
jgi:hypothetical protein